MSSLKDEIFELLIPPNETLFYSRGDKNDPRMGDIVLKDRKKFENIDVVLIGVPQDEGVKRNKGRPGASKAPDEIRRYLYRFAPFNFKFKKQITDLKIFDLGNLKTDGKLEEIHERLSFVVYELIKMGILPIVIGGGHDIAFPDYIGFAKNFEERAVLNIDTHLDVRDNQPRNSGTPFRQILECEYKPSKLIEIGIQSYANSIYHFEYALKNGIKIFTLDEIKERGIDSVLDAIKTNLKNFALHLSFDIDSVKGADAPGVSATYPDGLGTKEVIKIALYCGLNFNVKILDLAEVNPEFDIDGKTARLASYFILNFLTGVANSKI